jgi:cold shock protein
VEKWDIVHGNVTTAVAKNVEKAMTIGTVKFFNAQKGYGFISREGGADVFVHFSNIDGSGYRSLEEGQTVEFEIGQGRKGDEALKVRVV